MLTLFVSPFFFFYLCWVILLLSVLSDMVGSDIEIVLHNVVCSGDINVYVQTALVFSGVDGEWIVDWRVAVIHFGY